MNTVRLFENNWTKLTENRKWMAKKKRKKTLYNNTANTT